MIHIIDKIIDVPLNNRFGAYLSGAYRTVDDQNGIAADHLLVYLNLVARPCFLRINSACFTGDLFGDNRCDCNWQLTFTLDLIQQNQQGLLIYHLHHDGRGNGTVQKLRAFQSRLAQLENPPKIPDYMPDARRFQSTIAILKDLGVDSVNLISNNPKKARILIEAGIEVKAMTPIISDSPLLREYYKAKMRDFNVHA